MTCMERRKVFELHTTFPMNNEKKIIMEREAKTRIIILKSVVEEQTKYIQGLIIIRKQGIKG